MKKTKTTRLINLEKPLKNRVVEPNIIVKKYKKITAP